MNNVLCVLDVTKNQFPGGGGIDIICTNESN